MSVRARDTVLDLVRAAEEPVPAAEVARRLDMHVTTARYHLRNLAESGELTAVTLRTRGAGRPSVGYAPVAAIQVDEVLSAILDQLGDDAPARERAGAAAGRAWASRHCPESGRGREPDRHGLPDPVDVVTTALHRLGFKVSDLVSAFGTHEIRLCSCPLRHISAQHPEVARGVARGAIEFALRSGSPLLAEQYAVVVDPAPAGDCEITLRLSRSTAATHA